MINIYFIYLYYNNYIERLEQQKIGNNIKNCNEKKNGKIDFFILKVRYSL